uniref:Uncharacterized protein n=1 Tax=Anguilla anguilla TaxID=7936 RepID=A0A0E9PX94_ANGAN
MLFFLLVGCCYVYFFIFKTKAGGGRYYSSWFHRPQDFVLFSRRNSLEFSQRR